FFLLSCWPRASRAFPTRRSSDLVGFLLFVAMLGALVTRLRHLPSLQQRLSIVLLLTLAVGSMALSWDHRKQFWFVLGMLAVEVAQPTARRTLSPAVAARVRR